MLNSIFLILQPSIFVTGIRLRAKIFQQQKLLQIEKNIHIFKFLLKQKIRLKRIKN